MKNNPSIKCDVESCKYCDCEKKYCIKTLIKISTCDTGETPKDFTRCDSYKER